MYKKVKTDLDFVSREQEVLELWRKDEIFKKSVAQSEGTSCSLDTKSRSVFTFLYIVLPLSRYC